MSGFDLLLLALGFLVFFLGYRLGRRDGYRAGVRAPLGRRQAALRADLRRAENGLAAAVPRVRKARFSRRRNP